MANTDTIKAFIGDGTGRNQINPLTLSSTTETLFKTTGDNGTTGNVVLVLPSSPVFPVTLVGSGSPIDFDKNPAITTGEYGRKILLGTDAPFDSSSTFDRGCPFRLRVVGKTSLGNAPADNFAVNIYAGATPTLGGTSQLTSMSPVGGNASGPVSGHLGVASNYALLAYSGITNSGTSVITGGNIGSFPTATITGFPPGVLTAPAVVDNGNASAAQTALAAAIIYYQGLTPTLSGLGNLSTGGNGSSAATFNAGVYVGASSLTMPTGIILDAQGNPNATFVFVAGSTINLASGQTVALVNGAQAANVVFVAGSSFTSVATSTVNGNILAAVSITLGGGVLNGRALANTGAVTISAATAVTVPTGGGTGSVAFVNFCLEVFLQWDSITQKLGGYYNAVGSNGIFTNKATLTNNAIVTSASGLVFTISGVYGNASGGTCAIEEFSIEQV